MLLSIDIRDFAIIKSLQLDWNAGMSVITGETGAGKSIVIDALGLVLGNRAEQTVIGKDSNKAEVSAVFSIASNSSAYDWLKENDLLDEQNDQLAECILRRVIVREGRSKCYINGRNVTQSQLKTLGSCLVDIHGQHAHQSLLKSKEQLDLLDRFANHADLVDNVRLAFQQLSAIKEKQNQLLADKQNRDAKRELLTYQVDELTNANLEKSRLDSLEEEHKKAATSHDRLQIVEQAIFDLSEDESSACIDQLRKSISQVSKLLNYDPSLHGISETLTDAENLISDASYELSQYRESLNCDPQILEQLDQELALLHDLARKHQVTLQQLPDHFLKLKAELDSIQSDDQALERIQKDYLNAEKTYLCQAKLLTTSRIKTAKKLEKLVTEKVQTLAMEGGEFSIQINNTDKLSLKGMEEVEYLVSANPGQPLQALSKVASGGELSRISLAISAITSEHQLVPCIIFDEVDVGIGGATAEYVGELLKSLASSRQVLCVTHQPQVASCGDNHLVASKEKSIENNFTTTQITTLSKKQRIEEIARMLGGKVVSDKTISHATEMLKFS